MLSWQQEDGKNHWIVYTFLYDCFVIEKMTDFMKIVNSYSIMKTLVT